MSVVSFVQNTLQGSKLSNNGVLFIVSGVFCIIKNIKNNKLIQLKGFFCSADFVLKTLWNIIVLVNIKQNENLTTSVCSVLQDFLK